VVVAATEGAVAEKHMQEARAAEDGVVAVLGPEEDLEDEEGRMTEVEVQATVDKA
jgi:hypothetical protein